MLTAPGHPITPGLDQSPLIVTKPSLAVPAPAWQVPAALSWVDEAQMKTAEPLFTDGFLNAKTSPDRSASGSPEK